MGFLIKFRKFGPTVWSDIANIEIFINMSVDLYYLDLFRIRLGEDNFGASRYG